MIGELMKNACFRVDFLLNLHYISRFRISRKDFIDIVVSSNLLAMYAKKSPVWGLYCPKEVHPESCVVDLPLLSYSPNKIVDFAKSLSNSNDIKFTILSKTSIRLDFPTISDCLTFSRAAPYVALNTHYLNVRYPMQLLRDESLFSKTINTIQIEKKSNKSINFQTSPLISFRSSSIDV